MTDFEVAKAPNRTERWIDQSNLAVEQTAGSRTLAAAAHRSVRPTRDEP